MLFLAVLGIVVAAEVAWALITYLNGSAGKPEQLAFRLCVGREQKQCPSDTSFVQNAGEDTVTRWAQKECAGYKARRIIISDAPTKDCDCYMADVRCSSD
jgi:hypothetical protein